MEVEVKFPVMPEPEVRGTGSFTPPPEASQDTTENQGDEEEDCGCGK